MRRNILLLFAMLLSGVVAFGQTSLSGKVTDADTGEELMFATISLYKGDQLKGGIQTDFEGNYRFSNIDPGTYDVEFSYVGYASQKITGVFVKTGQNNKLDMALGSGINMTEVVVTEYRVPLIDQDNTTTGQTVTAKEIQNLTSKNINGIAAITPGVGSSDDGGGLTVRGSRDNATNYYVDGVRTNASMIPASEMEQAQIITGGIPAPIGDVTGGVVSVTSKGPSDKFSGSAEVETSQFLDAYGYNLASLALAGPILKNKDEQTVIGFRVYGQGIIKGDADPAGTGVYRVKESVVDDLTLEPTMLLPGSSRPVSRAQFLTADDVELVAARPNNSDATYNAGGKLEFQLSKAIDISVGGSFNYREFQTGGGISVGGADRGDGGRLLNYKNRSTAQNYDYRTYARFRHRIGSTVVNPDAEEGEKTASVIQNALYTLQVAYDKRWNTRQNDLHGDNLFNYGYIGDFDQTKNTPSITQTIEFTDSIPVFNAVHEGYTEILNSYTAGTVNPGLAAYNNLITDFATREDFIAFNGFYDDTRLNVYNFFSNVSRPYDLFRKQDFDLLTFNANSSFDLVFGGDSDKRHQIEFGVMYEQRTERSYGISPLGLWTQARVLANNHFDGLDTDTELSQLILTDPITSLTDTVIIHDNLAKDEIWAQAEFDKLVAAGTLPPGTTVQSLIEQSTFDKNLRAALGVGRTDWINVDGLNPDQLDLSYFSATEVPENIINYYGFDYLGNPIAPGEYSFDDFFTALDENGNRLLPVAPNQPIYTAAYIQDKFSFNDITFRIGVRLDRYDANTKVLKDPYLLYDTYQAGEFDNLKSDFELPATIDEDFYVYVDDFGTTVDQMTVTAYRDGDNWYDNSGNLVNEPGLIFGGTQALPARKDNVSIKDANFDPGSSFEDYTPQVNIMPRLAFSFPISDEANFYAHYDVLVQRPPSNTIATALDYYYFQERFGDGFNNPDLKPEKTVDYELGFKQKLTNSSAIGISAYYKELRDMIQSKNFLFAYPNTYTAFGNEDFSTVKGFTFQYDLRETNNVRVLAAYTLQFADGTGSGSVSQRGLQTRGNLRTTFPLTFDERHKLVTNITYAYGVGPKYNGPKWFGKDVFADGGASIIAEGSSGRPFTAAEAPELLGAGGTVGSINGARLPWKFRLDLRVYKNFTIAKSINVHAYFRVQNLLDQRNILNVYRYTQSPYDDGYLSTQRGIAQASGQIDTEAYTLSYQWALLNPSFFSLPRRLYIGAIVDF